MKKNQIKLATILTYSGTIPLILSVIILLFPLIELNGAIIARTYSAIIISFLCGIHWATYLFYAEKTLPNLLITSNVTAITAWASLLLGSDSLALSSQVLCFMFLMFLDFRLYRKGILPHWFFLLRKNATIIVLSCLAVIAIIS